MAISDHPFHEDALAGKRILVTGGGRHLTGPGTFADLSSPNGDQRRAADDAFEASSRHAKADRS